MTFIITELVYIFVAGAWVSHYIEDPLVAFGCCLLYGRVVVALTHSPFPFSILYVNMYLIFVKCFKKKSPRSRTIKWNKTMKKDKHKTGVIMVSRYGSVKSKIITKILNSEEIQNGKSLIKWKNQKLEYIKWMDTNYHIPDLVQAFSYVKNGGLKTGVYS